MSHKQFVASMVFELSTHGMQAAMPCRGATVCPSHGVQRS